MISWSFLKTAWTLGEGCGCSGSLGGPRAKPEHKLISCLFMGRSKPRERSEDHYAHSRLVMRYTVNIIKNKLKKKKLWKADISLFVSIFLLYNQLCNLWPHPDCLRMWWSPAPETEKTKTDTHSQGQENTWDCAVTRKNNQSINNGMMLTTDLWFTSMPWRIFIPSIPHKCQLFQVFNSLKVTMYFWTSFTCI